MGSGQKSDRIASKKLVTEGSSTWPTPRGIADLGNTHGPGARPQWKKNSRGSASDLAIEQEKIAKALKILRPLAELLDDGKEYGFRAEVSRNLRAGTMQYGRAATLISEIIAKQTARKNSAEYQEVFTKIEAQLGKAREILK